MIGLTISHYLITAKIGEGGMGEVYLAEDLRLDRKVAIKFLSTDLTLNEQATKQLVREARAAAKLDHPNICSIYDVGEADGKTFIVMQYADGKTLANVIQRTAVKIDEALHIAIQVAEALAEAHSRGIIHRDIKPQNIIISPNGQVKLLDFGIAKTIQDQSLTNSEALTLSSLTESGVIKGTVPYMSPEQVRGEVLDARSDTFAFGTVLYETITGRLPFVAQSVAETLAAILTHEPLPLIRYANGVPEALQRIVRKCLEKDRSRRYQTMRDVVTDLDNCRAAYKLARTKGHAERPTMLDWAEYDFPDDELELWADEICTAALELPPGSRPNFLSDACGGNDRLWERAQSKLRIGEGWSLTSTEKLGVCRPGEWIQDCFILYQVGQGGAAEVYKAVQASLRRLVAVKVIRNAEHRRLLQNEALRASQLTHENIATLYAADFQGDTPSVVMEYVEGQTLREELAGKQLGAGYTDEDVKSIIGQVARALRAAHLKGIVHRDIKPENIMTCVAEDGSTRVKVVDFGIAGVVHTAQWEITGTSGYIAPEQYGGQPADARADIFSLGVILYEMLTGTHPFWGETEFETHLNTRRKVPEPLPAAVAEKYDHVITKALQKDPDQRYKSIDDFLADLEESPSQPDLGNPFLSELPRPVRAWLDRNSYGFAVAALSFFLGVIAILLSIIARAACIRILWQPSQSTSFEMAYGFMVEPNAGLWYLLGAPLCFLAGFGFLQSAFVGISHTKTLSVYAGGHLDRHARPIEEIAEHNRRVFRFLTPAVILLAILVVLIPEYFARQHGAIGWVQADLPATLVAQNYWDLRDQGRVGEIPAVERLCRECPILVTRVTNRAGAYSTPSRPLFFAFLAIALSHQIALIFFIIWIALKNAFLFVELSKALPGTRADGLRLDPDFEDTNDYRLGLGQLDNAYNATLVFVLLGSSVFLLQALANLGKGTYFFTGNPNLQWLGQVATLAVTVAMIMFTIFWPTVLFILLTVRARAAALARLAIEQENLEKKLRLSPRSAKRDLEDELEVLRERRETIKRQSLLPLRNRTFRRLVVLSLVFLIIVPIAVGWLDLPGNSGAGSLILRKINNFTCSLCGNSN